MQEVRRRTKRYQLTAVVRRQQRCIIESFHCHTPLYRERVLCGAVRVHVDGVTWLAASVWLPAVLLLFARRQYSPLVKSALLFPAMRCLLTKVILIRHTLLGKHIYHRNAHLTACPMPMHVGVVWVCGVQVDLDGNGLINFAEFVTMMRKCKVDTDFDRQIREAFKVRRAYIGTQHPAL